MRHTAFEKLQEHLSEADRQRLLRLAADYGIDTNDPAWVGLAAAEQGIITAQRIVAALQSAEQTLTTMLKQLSLPLDDKPEIDVNELRQSKKQFAELLAMSEAIKTQQQARAQENAAELAANHRTVIEQVSAIQGLMDECKEVMTEAGAARWQLAAQSALQEGKEHLAALQSMTQDFTATTEQARSTLEHASRLAAGRFQWVARRLTLGVVGGALLGGVVTALLVAVLTAWYVTGRAPWVSHAEHQRLLTSGQYLQRVWPHLSQADRQRIERLASKP